MSGDIPGKLLVVVGVIIGGVLMFYEPGEMLKYGLWGLATVLVVIGLINWNVK